MEVRSAAAAAPAQVAEEPSVQLLDQEMEAPPARVSRRTPAVERRSRPGAVRATARPMVLSREQEYRYIRKDLQRLLITAGVLLVVMIVLLLVLES